MSFSMSLKHKILCLQDSDNDNDRAARTPFHYLSATVVYVVVVIFGTLFSLTPPAVKLGILLWLTYQVNWSYQFFHPLLDNQSWSEQYQSLNMEDWSQRSTNYKTLKHITINTFFVIPSLIFVTFWSFSTSSL